MAVDTRKTPPVRDFRLPSSRGAEVRLNDYRHRRSVVLFFVPDAGDSSARQRLRGFAAEYGAYQNWDAEVLAVIDGTPEQAEQLAETLALPFPVLADEEGKVWSEYVGKLRGPAIFVLDRYTALQQSEVAERAADLMSPGEALEWVKYAEMACPECGVSEWPA